MVSPSIRYLLPPPYLTVQHSAVNPRNTQQIKYAPIRARQRRRADGVGSRQHIAEHTYNSLCSQNERIIEICSAYKNIAAGGVMREGFACTLLFLSVLSISSMHAASGLFLWTTELLAFACQQFAPKIMDLSVRFIHSHFVQFFLVSGRSGRRKPPAERSALYRLTFVFVPQRAPLAPIWPLRAPT